MYRGENMARTYILKEEVDLLARLIKSEALGEGEEGMLLVGNVVSQSSCCPTVMFLEMSNFNY